MPKKFEAGVAYLHVVPSLEGLHKRIERELDGVPDELLINVKLVTAGAEKSLDGLGEELAQPAAVRVDADTEPARRAVADFRRDLARRQDEVVVQARIRELTESTPLIPQQAATDTAAADAGIGRLREQRIRAETEALAGQGRLQARLDDLHAQRDTRLSGLDAQSNEVWAQVAELTGQRAAGADVGSGLDEAMDRLRALGDEKHAVRLEFAPDLSRAQSELDLAKARWEHDRIRLDVGISSARRLREEVRQALASELSRTQADVLDVLQRRNTVSLLGDADLRGMQARATELTETAPLQRLDTATGTAQADAAMQRLQAQRVRAETESQAAVQRLRAQIDEVTHRRYTAQLRFDVDRAALVREIDELLRQRELGINVDADLTLAELRLQRLEEEHRLVQLQADVDLRGADAQIALAKAQWEHDAIQLDTAITDTDKLREDLRRTLTEETAAALRDAGELAARQNTTRVSGLADAARSRARIDELGRTAEPSRDVEEAPDVRAARTAVERLRAQLDTAEVTRDTTVREALARISELDTQRQNRLAANAAEQDALRRQIAELQQQHEELGIDVTLEMDNAEAQLEKLEHERRVVDIEVDADTERLQRSILEAQAEYGHAEITIGADISDAEWKLEQVESEVDDLDGRDATVRADAEGAERAASRIALVTTALSALSAAGPAAVAVLATVPLALTGIGQVAGTIAAGLNGIGDAVKAMDTVRVANLTGKGASAAQIEKMNDALAGLGPQAQAFAHMLQDQVLPALRGVGDGAQESLLPPVQQALGQLLRLGPQVTATFKDTGVVIGDLAQRGAAMVTSGPWTTDFGTVARSNTAILADLGGTGMALADALRSVTAAAGPTGEGIAEWVENAALKVNEFVQSARESGQMAVWFDEASASVSRLLGILQNAAGDALSLAGALAPVGQSLLDVATGVVGFVGDLATAMPLLIQLAATASIALGAFIAFGRGIGGLTTAFGTARQGWQAWSNAMAAWQFRAVTAGATMDYWTQRVTGNGRAGEFAGRATGGLLSGVGRLVGILPNAALVVGGLALALDGLTTSSSEATDALLQGGTAAQQMQQDLAYNLTVRQGLNFIGDPIGYLLQSQAERRADAQQSDAGNPFGGLLDWLLPTQQTAQAEAQQRLNNMGPLDRALTLRNQAQADYDLTVRDTGPVSEQSIAAQQRLALATNEVERAQAAAAEATKSHTDRMLEQQQQAMTMLDRDLALRVALNQTQQAQQAAAEAVNQYGVNSLQAQTASLGLEQAMIQAANAARAKTEAQHQSAAAEDRSRFATAAYNQTLADLVAQAGTAAPVALRQYLAGLDSSALAAIGARIQTDAFGNAVLVLPGEKSVALGVRGDADAIARINNLRAAIDAMPPNKWFTAYVRTVITDPPPRQTNPSIPLPLVPNAAGALLQRFAAGGIVGGLTPMRPVAQVVPPRTWRVVGDRMTGDEAFIPIDESARSQAILTETARRMGYTLLPAGQTAPMAFGGLLASRLFTPAPRPGRTLPADRDQITAGTTYAPQITVHARTDASPEHIAAAVDRRLRIRSRL